jgi:hypothetical protein
MVEAIWRHEAAKQLINKEQSVYFMIIDIAARVLVYPTMGLFF